MEVLIQSFHGQLRYQMPLDPMAVCDCKEMNALTLGAADQDAIVIGFIEVSYEYSLPLVLEE